MPFNLKEKPCQICGTPMRRIKLCLPCAKVRKKQYIKEINTNYKLKIQELNIEKENQSELLFKTFAWDNPNDPHIN